MQPTKPAPTAREYSEQLTTEVTNATQILQRVEWMMATAIVEPTVLHEFRESINRVRNTGWIIQKSLSEEDGIAAAELLAQERIRCITTMSDQLFQDLRNVDTDLLEGFETLLESVEKLAAVIRLRLERSETL